MYPNLYVANESPNSVRARANLEAICREYLVEGRYHLAVIDILKDPLRALDDGILVTPTLICLGDRQAVLSSLGLSEDAERRNE
jgi:circadian clock protein KaiB